MNKTKVLFSITFVYLFCLTNIFAQTEKPQPQAEPNYEVILQVLTGSNTSGDKTSLPPSLSNVVKKLKTLYSYSNYSLNSTYFERVANKGSVDFKGISNELDQSQEKYAPVFLEWTFNRLEILPNSQGKSSIQFEGFRFGQRVIVKNTGYKSEDDKTKAGTNYEYIGLTQKQINVAENIPTIIGSLSTSKPDELVFLILTVKPADQ